MRAESLRQPTEICPQRACVEQEDSRRRIAIQRCRFVCRPRQNARREILKVSDDPFNRWAEQGVRTQDLNFGSHSNQSLPPLLLKRRAGTSTITAETRITRPNIVFPLRKARPFLSDVGLTALMTFLRLSLRSLRCTAPFPKRTGKSALAARCRAVVLPLPQSVASALGFPAFAVTGDRSSREGEPLPHATACIRRSVRGAELGWAFCAPEADPAKRAIAVL